MNRTNLTIIGVVFLFLTLSCSTFMKGKNLSEPAAKNFHDQLNAGKYTEIYAQADDAFKRVVPEKKWIEMCEKIQRKLGSFKSSKSTGIKTNTNNSGTFATITYDSEFTVGPATEEFMFRITDDKALLFNYELNSPHWAEK